MLMIKIKNTYLEINVKLATNHKTFEEQQNASYSQEEQATMLLFKMWCHFLKSKFQENNIYTFQPCGWLIIIGTKFKFFFEAVFSHYFDFIVIYIHYTYTFNNKKIMREFHLLFFYPDTLDCENYRYGTGHVDDISMQYFIFNVIKIHFWHSYKSEL